MLTLVFKLAYERMAGAYSGVQARILENGWCLLWCSSSHMREWLMLTLVFRLAYERKAGA